MAFAIGDIIPPMPRIVGIKEAARRAGVTEELLALWVSTGRVIPTESHPKTYLPVPDRPNEQREDFAVPAFYAFDERNIEQIRAMVEQTAAKKTKAESAHVKGSHYSVQELAALWGLGVDKIRELFEDEQGVIKIQRPPKRGRRAYVTLRIPENVAERVQRRTSCLTNA